VLGIIAVVTAFGRATEAQTCISPVWMPRMGLSGFQNGAQQGLVMLNFGTGLHPVGYGSMSRWDSHFEFTLYGIAEWDGKNWSPLVGELPETPINGANVWVDLTGTSLLVTGNRGHFGTVYGGGVGRWNNGVWSAMGSGITGFGSTGGCSALYDDGIGLAWYVGGDFDTMDGVTCHGIAKWNRASWSALETGFQGAVPVAYFMASYDKDGPGPKKPALFVARDFDSAGNVNNTKYIARWNGTA